MNRKQCLHSFVIIILILIKSQICSAGGVSERYPQVRVQENGWIKILEQREEEKFDEHFGFNTWELHVKVLFLKYCKASKKKSRFEDPNASVDDLAKALGAELANPDYIVPMYRCNYRTTVFLSVQKFESPSPWDSMPDGYESTMKIIPHTTQNKIEIFPGETIWVTFLHPVIPKKGMTKPVSWQVWVPK